MVLINVSQRHLTAISESAKPSASIDPLTARVSCI